MFTLYNDPKKETSEAINSESALQSKAEYIEPSFTTANISIDKQHKFDKVRGLHSKGISIKQIARTVKLTRTTVRRYIAMEQLVKRQSHSTTNLDAFIDFLIEEDNRGKTYRDLHKKIIEMGVNDKYTQFCCKMNEIYDMQPSLRPKSTGRALV
ncbi:MAG: hypothetical protein EOO43_17000 [Flavobacterium sp.]|nr:MAG: hypothetical protein EOO43_17000 [Flavobacterium sp.]